MFAGVERSCDRLAGSYYYLAAKQSRLLETAMCRNTLVGSIRLTRVGALGRSHHHCARIFKHSRLTPCWTDDDNLWTPRDMAPNAHLFASLVLKDPSGEDHAPTNIYLLQWLFVFRIVETIASRSQRRTIRAVGAVLCCPA